MFTLADVCNIAIQIERNGEAAYRRAAQNSKNSEIIYFFEQMADEEKQHAEWFSKLSIAAGPIDKDAPIEKMGRELLQNMMAHQTFSMDTQSLAGADRMDAALQQSIEFENDTILFYEMLHGFLEDSKTMRYLENIIAEEQSHIDKLKRIAQKLIADNQMS